MSGNARSSAYSQLPRDDQALVDRYANHMLQQELGGRRMSKQQQEQFVSRTREATVTNTGLLTSIRTALNPQTAACTGPSYSVLTTIGAPQEMQVALIQAAFGSPLPANLDPNTLRNCTEADINLASTGIPRGQGSGVPSR